MRLRSFLSQAAPYIKSDRLMDVAIRRNPLLRRQILTAIEGWDDLSRANLTALTDRFTNRTLRAARQTPYGRAKNDNCPGWPILDRDQVRSAPQSFVKPLHLVRVPASTGGTTGKPLMLWRSMECIVAEQVFLDGLLAPHGLSMHGSRVAVLRADKVKDANDVEPPYGTLSHGGKRLTLSTPHLNARTVAWFYDALKNFAPSILWVYPSAILSLMTLLDSVHARLSIPVVLASSEVVSAELHAALESRLNCNVINYYGQAERVCFAHSTRPNEFRFNPCYGRVELVPSEANEDTAVRRFKIIATSHWNTAMPLVRYDTGDYLAVPKHYDEADLKDVSLGRQPFLRLEGREGEYLLTAEGVRIIGLNQIPREMRNVFQLQLVQYSFDAVTINVVTTPSFSAEDASQLLGQARAKIPASIDIALNVTDHLTVNAAGKAPFVLRLVD
jgi:phenylacetate-CoA ligase